MAESSVAIVKSNIAKINGGALCGHLMAESSVATVKSNIVKINGEA